MASVFSATGHDASLSERIPPLKAFTRHRQTQQEDSTSIPETLSLPPPSAPRPEACCVPAKKILSKRDHDLFLASPTHQLIISFVFTLSDSVTDKTISSVSQEARHPVIDKILTVLDQAHDLVRQCPAEEAGGSRFGNKSFRQFLDKVDGVLITWHEQVGLSDETVIKEVSTYLCHAFGNGARIDYGSGHELNFVIWLLCLNRLSLLPPAAFSQAVLLVFKRYLGLMRAIQTTYYLEPAGSHGVWGLDDYQFLPFLFGASQLLHHPHLRPMSIHQSMILEQCASDYLYLDQIAFINSVKNVEGLRWHSPMLDDISSAKSWAKVNGGMRKMFLAEVLGKLPVMQHFLFGSLIPAVEGMGLGDTASDGESACPDGGTHLHKATGWGDCCGIAVPGSIGAGLEAKKQQQEQGLRRLPFD